MVFSLFNRADKAEKVNETSLAKFVRTATAEEKKKVYSKVLRRATDRQVELIEEVLREQRARAPDAARQSGDKPTRE